MKTPHHTDIPVYVYATLRAVHDSRAKRRDNDAVVPFLPNATIFSMMPDHRDIIWTKDDQPALTAATLAAMASTVKWSD